MICLKTGFSGALLSTPSGTGMDSEGNRPHGILRYITSQIEITANNFEAYADFNETRREHLADLLVELGLRTLGGSEYRPSTSPARRLPLAKGCRSGSPETASSGSQSAGRSTLSLEIRPRLWLRSKGFGSWRRDRENPMRVGFFYLLIDGLGTDATERKINN